MIMRLVWLLFAASTSVQAIAVNSTSVRLSAQIDVDVKQPEADPPWIEKYIQFHKQTRGQPAAKYLVSFCGRDAHCGGLGDRMRGILYALAIAAHHKRVVLIHWDDPAVLETFFIPNQINWTVSSDLNVDIHGPDVVTLQAVSNVSHITKEMISTEDKLWVYSGTWLACRDGMPPDMPPFERVSWTSHLLMNALFKPSPELLVKTDKEHKRLFGSLDRKFTAMHLRMGHLDGEPALQARSSDNLLHNFLAGVDCSSRLAKMLNPDSKPGQPAILAVTDHYELRRMIQNNVFPGVVSPGGDAHHIKEAVNTTTVKQHFSTFVDLMLLSRASCLVWSDSGFGKTAMMIAWHKCHCELTFCIHDLFDSTRLGGTGIYTKRTLGALSSATTGRRKLRSGP